MHQVFIGWYGKNMHTLHTHSLQGSLLWLPSKLHSQRVHCGKSLKPNAHRSHFSPAKPSLHRQWPADRPTRHKPAAQTTFWDREEEADAVMFYPCLRSRDRRLWRTRDSPNLSRHTDTPHTADRHTGTPETHTHTSTGLIFTSLFWSRFNMKIFQH